MKTIRKGDEIKRASDKDAEYKVKNQGYEYCPKNIWKKNVRSVVVKPPTTSNTEEQKTKKKTSKKLTRSEKRDLKNEN